MKNNKIKKILAILLIITLLLPVTGCGKNKGSQATNSSNNESVYKLNKANIEETVILDRDNLKVTAKEIVYDSKFGPEIKLFIENNSDKNIVIQADNLSINGLMTDPILSAAVSAGKKANDSIVLDIEELEISKIKTIKDLEFNLLVFEDESYEDIFEEKEIKLTTDAKNYTQEYNHGGELLLDQNNIKIYILKDKIIDNSVGKDLYFYIENNTDSTIDIQAKDVSVNDMMVKSLFFASITSNKKMYVPLTIYKEEITKNDITKINNVELKFNAYNIETWDDVIYTDMIKINY